MVIDVRADDRIEAADAEAFAVTAEVCARLGWEFWRAGEIDPVLGANVRWLARYRHPRCAGRAEVTRRLREAFAGSAPLLAGAAEAGDPLATLPAQNGLGSACYGPYVPSAAIPITSTGIW